MWALGDRNILGEDPFNTRKMQLIGTGGLRLQSERAQGGGGVVASRRRVDVGQLHWQDVPPSYRQHRATARGLPDLIARCNISHFQIFSLIFPSSSILPQKKKYRGNEKKKKKAFKAKKRVDKSKFNPPKVVSHGFEPYFRVSSFYLLLQLTQFHVWGKPSTRDKQRQNRRN